jgi:hypothetical protein
MLQLVLMHIGSHYFSYSSLHLLQIAGELLLVGSYSAELSIKAFFWRYWIHLCGNTDFLFFWFSALVCVLHFPADFSV